MTTETKTRPKVESTTKLAPRHNLVLLDDDDHTYEYVIEMLRAIFGYDEQKAFMLAAEVDATGRSIIFTAHKELVELKQDQVHGFGADWRIPACKGSMTAVIEEVSS